MPRTNSARRELPEPRRSLPNDPADSEREALAPRVLEAARRAFFAHGFRGVTMQDLARELGISKKTLYTVFESKDDVLRAILQAKAAAVDADLGVIAKLATRDPVGAIDQALECVRRHTAEITPNFLRDLQREQPQLLAWLEARRAEFLRTHFGHILHESRKAGELREDVSIELVIEILLAAAHAVTTNPRVTELGLSERAGFAPVIRIIVDGIRAPRKRRKP